MVLQRRLRGGAVILPARKPAKVVAVALANNAVRIVWGRARVHYEGFCAKCPASVNWRRHFDLPQFLDRSSLHP